MISKWARLIVVSIFTALVAQPCGVAADLGGMEGISAATTNYASAYLGAKIVDHHPAAKGAHYVLNEDRDKYMIVPCKERRKQFTVQLSREVELSIVAISNMEYFSSAVRNFTLLGSRHYPCVAPACMWRVLGSFEAQFVRSVQRFIIAKQAAVRFLRFQWVTHHGFEKSCTMTALQAFGTDMLETLAAELNSHGVGADDDDADADEVPATTAARTETHYVRDYAPPDIAMEDMELLSGSGASGGVQGSAAAGATAGGGAAATGSAGGGGGAGDGAQRPKWRPVPVIFPVRNSSVVASRQCVAADRDVEHFYEVGPGARCYKKAKVVHPPKDKAHPASLLALPHVQRQLRALHQEAARAHKRLVWLEGAAGQLSVSVARLGDDMTREGRQTASSLDALFVKLGAVTRQLNLLSAEWELRFAETHGSHSVGLHTVVWWLVGLNAFAIALLLVLCFGRTMPSSTIHHGLPRSHYTADGHSPHGAVGEGALRAVDSATPGNAGGARGMFPLSASSATLDDLGQGATPHVEEAVECAAAQ